MKAKRIGKLDPERSMIENAARIVRVRLDELRSLAAGALRFDGAEEQHDLRIAAKRLRYVLEVTGFCFGAPADRARRRARDLQDVLGDLHDCDVLLPRIQEQVERLRDEDAATIRARADGPDLDAALVAVAPNRTAYRGLETLAVYAQGRRGLLFDRFVELWERCERDRVWERLEQAIEDRLEAQSKRRAAAERAVKAARKLERAERDERDAADRAQRAAAALAEARRAQSIQDRSP